jgi:DNA-binding CsgD family transcriptional regulator/PAS domain-containing protein
MTSEERLAIQDIIDVCTRMGSFVETRQRITDLLTRRGELRYGHFIDLKAMYAGQCWDNVSSGVDINIEKFEKEHQHYLHANPVVPIQPTLTREQAVFRHGELVGESLWSECSFVQDFTRHYDMLDGVIMLLHSPDGELRWGFGAGHPRKQGVKKKYLRLLRILAPFLSQAVLNLESWYGTEESARSLRAIVEHSREAIILLAPPTSRGGARILEATPSALEALGASAQWSGSLHVREFIEIALASVGRSVEWRDARGQRCMISTMRSKIVQGETETWLVRIEPTPNPNTGLQNLLQSGISLREAHVLRRVSEGLSDKEIGAAMKISRHTVRAHLRRVYSKLGVFGRMEAVNAVARIVSAKKL